MKEFPLNAVAVASFFAVLLTNVEDLPGVQASLVSVVALSAGYNRRKQLWQMFCGAWLLAATGVRDKRLLSFDGARESQIVVHSRDVGKLDLFFSDALVALIVSKVDFLTKEQVEQLVDCVLFKDEHGEAYVQETRIQLLQTLIKTYAWHALGSRAIDEVLAVLMRYAANNTQDASNILHTIVRHVSSPDGEGGQAVKLAGGVNVPTTCFEDQAFRNMLMSVLIGVWQKHESVKAKFEECLTVLNNSQPLHDWMPGALIHQRQMVSGILYKDQLEARDILAKIDDDAFEHIYRKSQILALHSNRISLLNLPRLLLQELADKLEQPDVSSIFQPLLAQYAEAYSQWISVLGQLSLKDLGQTFPVIYPADLAGEAKVVYDINEQFARPLFSAAMEHSSTLVINPSARNFLPLMARISAFCVSEQSYNSKPSNVRAFYNDLTNLVRKNPAFFTNYSALTRSRNWELILRCLFYKDRNYSLISTFIPYLSDLAEVWLDTLCDTSVEQSSRDQALDYTAECIEGVHLQSEGRYESAWELVTGNMMSSEAKTLCVLPQASKISREGLVLLNEYVKQSQSVDLGVDFIQLLLTALLPENYTRRIQSVEDFGRLLTLLQLTSHRRSVGPNENVSEDYTILSKSECLVKNSLNLVQTQLHGGYNFHTAIPKLTDLIYAHYQNHEQDEPVISEYLEGISKAQFIEAWRILFSKKFLKRVHISLVELMDCFGEAEDAEQGMVMQDRARFYQIISDFFAGVENYNDLGFLSKIQDFRQVLSCDNGVVTKVLTSKGVQPASSTATQSFVEAFCTFAKESQPFDDLLAGVFQSLSDMYAGQVAFEEMGIADDRAYQTQMFELLVLQVSKLWLIDDTHKSSLDALNTLRRHPETASLLTSFISSGVLDDWIPTKDKVAKENINAWLNAVLDKMLSMDDERFKLFCEDLSVLQGSEGQQSQHFYELMAKEYFSDVSDTIAKIFSDSYPTAKSVFAGKFFGSIGLQFLNNPPKDFLQFSCRLMTYFYQFTDMALLRNSLLRGHYILAANMFIDGVLRPKGDLRKVKASQAKLWTSFGEIKDRSQQLGNVLSAMIPLPKNVSRYVCDQSTYWKGMSCWFLALLQVSMCLLCIPLTLFYRSYREQFFTNMKRMVSSTKHLLLNIYQLPVAVCFSLGLVVHMVLGVTFESAKFICSLPRRIMTMDIKQSMVRHLGLNHFLGLMAMGLAVSMFVYSTSPIHFIALSASFLWFLPVGVGMFTKSSLKGVFCRPLPAQKLRKGSVNIGSPRKVPSLSRVTSMRRTPSR